MQKTKIMASGPIISRQIEKEKVEAVRNFFWGDSKITTDGDCSYEIKRHLLLAKLLQSCPTLCDPIDGSPPGSAVPGILQARTLEWVAISFSKTLY